MKVLSIDPGSINAGFAVLEKRGRKVHYIDSGVLSFSAKDAFILRIKDIFKKTSDLLQQYEPDHVALESLIFVKSPTSLIKLSQARGVMLAAMSEKYHEKIYEYSPNLVKQTVTGHGHADKEGIQKVLMNIFGLKKFKTHDESDAVAIALCHCLNIPLLHTSQSMLPSRTRSSKSKGLASSVQHKLRS